MHVQLHRRANDAHCFLFVITLEVEGNALVLMVNFFVLVCKLELWVYVLSAKRRMSSLNKTEQVGEGFRRFLCSCTVLHLLNAGVLYTMYLLLWMTSAYALVSRGCLFCSLERLWFPVELLLLPTPLFCLDAKGSSRWNGRDRADGWPFLKCMCCITYCSSGKGYP